MLEVSVQWRRRSQMNGCVALETISDLRILFYSFDNSITEIIEDSLPNRSHEIPSIHKMLTIIRKVHTHIPLNEIYKYSFLILFFNNRFFKNKLDVLPKPRSFTRTYLIIKSISHYQGKFTLLFQLSI